MKIQEIRDTIDRLNWNRQDLYGATREEFTRMDVPERLNKHIEAVRRLEIKPRFEREIADARRAIEAALRMIEKWEAMQQPAHQANTEVSEQGLELWLHHAERAGIIEHIEIGAV
uniref:hypothetical protein n=1 Tax=Sulfuriferula sp. GW6 TaxID=3345112 RepID=UPI0039F6D288